MKQLTQNLKTGLMEISEVPFPSLSSGRILVRNHFSLISAGTEGHKVTVARKSLLGKAKEKPEQVKLVLETVKREGIINTYKKVMNKLDSLSALGYSCAGEVIEVPAGCKTFAVGDRVACAGQDIANHAEVVSVPENLAIKIPIGVSLSSAAYTTVGVIALQGIRQAELHLGESCVVIGLGLIGQLTVQMLKASGIKVFGVDLTKYSVDTAITLGADLALLSSDSQLKQAILDFSFGFGVDAVIITAGTNSLGPINVAGNYCRSKGKVIIVGAVPTGFDREQFYKKELDLRMSCSYGPGRYNSNYEEKGMDFPIGYVRWTENRNMQAFLELVRQKKVNTEAITTHLYNFEDVLTAYDLIVNRKENYLGIILQYSTETSLKLHVGIPAKGSINSLNGIGFIGAGSFAQNSLLPHLKNERLVSVVTQSSHTGKNVAQKFSFENAVSSTQDILINPEIKTVFIATRHNLHAVNVIAALNYNKNIFVEKPLCLFEVELEEIKLLYESKNVHLMVGFNRRFAPFIQNIKKLLLPGKPVSIVYNINAGFIEKDNWIQDESLGGGRVLGEVCHFIDLVNYITVSPPRTLSAITLRNSSEMNDTLSIQISYENGSIANINYFSNGPKSLEKELLEVFSHGMTFQIKDFKELNIYGTKKCTKKSSSQDKGHAAEVAAFVMAIKNGLPTPISFQDIYSSTKMTFDSIKSISKRATIVY